MKITMTLFLDIDGCILKHQDGLTNILRNQPEVLPGVYKKFHEWSSGGHMIILVTGRPESMRKFTEDQLLNLGLFYDQLIMGLTNGYRILINDKKPNMDITAKAYNLERNKGLGDIEE